MRSEPVAEAIEKALFDLVHGGGVILWTLLGDLDRAHHRADPAAGDEVEVIQQTMDQAGPERVPAPGRVQHVFRCHGGSPSLRPRASR